MPRAETQRIYDELLVTLVRSGDQRAAARLAARWYPKLMRTALALLGQRDDAQEAVQETWAAICKGWLRLSDPGQFPAWAYGILRRKCADRIRVAQRDRQREVSLADVPEPQAAVSTALRLDIDQALAGLSANHRIAAILFFSEGLSLTELAAVQGVPIGTAKSRVFHARKHLKSSLKGDL